MDGGFGGGGMGGGLPLNFSQIESDMNGFFCPGINMPTMNNDTLWTPSNDGAFNNPQFDQGGLTPSRQHGNVLISGLILHKGGSDLDIRFRDTKRSHIQDFHEDKDLDNPMYDQRGDNRNWQNWGVNTFIPLGSSKRQQVGSGGGYSGGASQATSDMNCYNGVSHKLSELIS